MAGKRVVLRDTSDSEGTRYLQASLSEKGDLLIEGQDLGAGVERILGSREYEWAWTVRTHDLPALLQAMDAGPDVLSGLEGQFSGDNAAGLQAFLETHDIAFEFWSRMGD